jgi:hypothetical protein
VVTNHDLSKTIGNIDVCIEFELLQVKVPIVFLGTVGFSLPREGRYPSTAGLVDPSLSNAPSPSRPNVEACENRRLKIYTSYPLHPVS